MSRVWELRSRDEKGREVCRIFRADSLKIGSAPGNHFRLPMPCPATLVVLDKRDSKVRARVQAPGFKMKSLRSKALTFSWNDQNFEVREIGAENRFQTIEPKTIDVEQSIENHDSTRQTLWLFAHGRLIESTQLTVEDGDESFITLKVGLGFRLDYYTRALQLRDRTGQIKSVTLSKHGEGFIAHYNFYTMILTSTPHDEDFAGLIDEKYQPKKKSRFAPFLFTLMCSWLIFIALFQFGYGPGSEEEYLEEALPKELTKVAVEKKIAKKETKKPPVEKRGIKGGKAGGGGVRTARKDPRGGSGIAKPDEVLVKSRQVLKSMGSVFSALGAVDKSVRKNNRKVSKAGTGMGGRNISSGILKSLGNSFGSGGGGVGIGGLGTKGFGGGGGGGSGRGFGTGIGNGVGEGNGLRAIKFGAGKAQVRGGLERSEVEAVIKQNLSKIRYCYNMGLRSQPSLEGKVKTSFVIAGSGRMQSVRIAGSSLGSPQVESCIKRQMAKWKFPKPRGGGIVKVNYPFLLKPGI